MRNLLLSFLLLVGCLSGTPPLYAQLIARNQPARPQLISQTDPAYNAGSLNLRDALMQLKKQHSVDILFEEKLLDGLFVRASLLTTNTSLETTLNILLKPTKLQYRRIRKDAYVILTTKPDPRLGFQAAPVLPESFGRTESEAWSPILRTVQPISQPQDRRISGRVTTADGNEGLPGVNVSLKGTNRGTTTDGSGNYVLNLPDPVGGIGNGRDYADLLIYWLPDPGRSGW